MRISDWSSDVCSSDLPAQPDREADLSQVRPGRPQARRLQGSEDQIVGDLPPAFSGPDPAFSFGSNSSTDRQSVVQGKSVSVRVDLGGRRTIKKKNNNIRPTAQKHI